MKILVVLLFFFPSSVLAQKMSVKIIQRQTSETGYTYQVAGHSTTTSSGGANCNGSSLGMSMNVNCSGSGTSQTSTTAPMVYSYSVTGATFSLLISDGRIAVVNCVSKFAEHFAGPTGNHRSCRMPIIDDITAEFNGKKAKLFWPVSLDGKKFESETYEIIGIIPK